MVRSHRVGIAVGLFSLVLGSCYWLTAGNAQPQDASKSPAQEKTSDARPNQDKEPALAKFMRAKLQASSQILEGLCTEDFALIEKGAETLNTMSREERWRVSNDVMYRQHSAEFRNSVENILKAAQDKQNIDTAALAWTKTTLNCIECHRWVRNTLVADRRKPDRSE
jgi:cytochrome c556